MNSINGTPRPLGWLYRLAMGVAIFTGMGQMPILKRYYVTDLPLMGWSENFYTLSDLHYLAAAMLLFLLAWRLTIGRGQGRTWSWGPLSWWGWLLLALLVVSGAAKVMRNSGYYLSPLTLMYLDFIHLGSAMAFMFTGLAALFRGPRQADRRLKL